MEFLDEIKAKFPNVLESVDGSNENESVLLLKDKTKIKRVCKEVKNHFDILFMLMAVDKPPKIFELNYVFSSYKTQNILTIRVNIERDKAVIDSISSLFESADWEERETYDLFGVEFIGHKNLKRILLPEDWPGRPLRKDFEVTDEVRNLTGLDLKF